MERRTEERTQRRDGEGWARVGNGSRRKWRLDAGVGGKIFVLES